MSFEIFKHLFQQNRQLCIKRFADINLLQVFICIVWRILQQENQLHTISYDVFEQFNFYHIPIDEPAHRPLQLRQLDQLRRPLFPHRPKLQLLLEQLQLRQP